MSYYDREEKILAELFEKGTVTAQELSAKLFVSLPTIRRDLIRMAQKGKIVRTHGGARLLTQAADQKIPFYLRQQEQNNAKTLMAQKAVTLIKDGDTIMLDGSTSAHSIIPLLHDFNNLIVITSSAKSAFLLGEMGIQNICTGGRMISRSLSYIGEDAERTVKNYNADIVFFSCRGLSADGHLTDNSVEENRLRRYMLQQSAKRVLLCDSSKIGKTYLNNLCHLSCVDVLICETAAPKELTGMLRKEK